jgi:hypothetical protein
VKQANVAEPVWFENAKERPWLRLGAWPQDRAEALRWLEELAKERSRVLSTTPTEGPNTVWSQRRLALITMRKRQINRQINALPPQDGVHLGKREIIGRECLSDADTVTALLCVMGEMAEVAEYHGATRDELFTEDRQRVMRLAKQLAAKLKHEEGWE